MLDIVPSNIFKKDLEKVKKQNKDLNKLFDLLKILSKEEKIPDKNKDHKLKGNLKDYRELHIEPDWLLIYQIEGNMLRLIGTGSHSYLFDK